MPTMRDADFSSTKDLGSSYDFIVVGGGQAGVVLATRLSEEPVSVLLIEAGRSNLGDPLVLTPPFAPQMYGNADYDWNFRTEAQAGFGGRPIVHPRGKALGGTSAINLNMISFPSQAIVDAWAALGNPGWDWASLAPYYRKFHTFHEPSAAVRDALGLEYLDARRHGTSGPIQVSYGADPPAINQAWVKTFTNLGHVPQSDPSTGNHFGGYSAPCSIDPATHTRSYAAAYLTDAVRQRPHLAIVTEATVEQIVIESKVATGVRFRDRTGRVAVIHCRNEVLLCGGTFHSPQILELSGVGNRAFLQSKGIEPKVHLPGVGENLQDHANVGVSFESVEPTFDSFRDPAVLGAAVAEYTESKTGPLAGSTLCAAAMPARILSDTDAFGRFQALLDQSIAAASPSTAAQYARMRAIVEDKELSCVEHLLAPVQLSRDQSGAVAGLDADATAADYYTIFTALSHPFSRGSVHVTSTDPGEKPAVDPRYLSHPLDAEILAQQLMFLETIVKTEPLASFLKPTGRRIPPHVDLTTLDGAREAARTGFTVYHPVGTCAMMPADQNGVVDPNLKVHGVQGLRVVDASIMPLLPRGPTQATVYAIAERAADLIKAEYAGTGTQ